MGRRIIYHKKFWQEVDEIFEYLRINNSLSVAKKFLLKVREKTSKIKQNPYAYSVDPILSGLGKEYRRAIVMKHWKIVYRVTEDKIVFLGIVDMSRDPNYLRQIGERG